MSEILGQNIRVEGINEFYDSLKQLNLKTRSSILRSVNRKLMSIPKKSLIEAIRGRGYGRSQRKFGIKEKHVLIVPDKYNRSGVLLSLDQDAFAARFIEAGTQIRYNVQRNKKKLSKQAHRGAIKADPFIVPAHEESESKIATMIENEYGRIVHGAIASRNRSIQRKLVKL